MGGIITLITDFGLEDGHVGAMKGVIQGIAPTATLTDITHLVPPQDIRKAAYALLTAYPHFPHGTIHLIVVDPGVGTARRAVAVRTPSATFVAPDNGVLSYVLDREPALKAVSLTNQRYWHHPVSPIFHGRDIFGPAAAHLAAGVPLEELGEVIDPDTLVTFPVSRPRRQPDGSIVAHVQVIDSFGNCTTDLPAEWLSVAPAWVVEVAGRRIQGVRQTFGQVAVGEAVALIDSENYLMIAVRNSSAARDLGLALGDEVLLYPLKI